MKIKFYENNKSTGNNIVAGITLKDKPATALQSRQRLAEALNISLDNFVCPSQTHSDNFYEATRSDGGRGAKDLTTAILDTDALFTYESDLLLCCFTADCVPLIFHNEKEGLIGLIHSGWRGSVKEITLKVFNHLTKEKDHNPKNFKIIIGPAISQEKFEVDEDVYLEFKNLGYALPYIYFNKEINKYHIDNKAIVKMQCQLAGIPEKNIFIDPTCTYLDENCFSYRREKQTGRHLSFIARFSQPLL